MRPWPAAAAARYTDRLTRFVPIAGGALIGLFGVVSVLGRRAERGLYRSVGASNRAVAVILVAELGVVLLSSALAAAALGAPVGARWGAPYAAIVGPVVLGFGVAVLVTAIGVLVTPRASVSELVRDR